MARHKVRTTADKLSRALRQAKHFDALDRRLAKAGYDSDHDRIRLTLTDGILVEIPRNYVQGLERATPAQLRNIEILGRGTGLHWPQLDVDHYVPGLLNHVFGTTQWMATLGRRGGAARTPAKVAAARANGRRGGRPAKRAG